jgi:hypothetical protein
MPAWTEQDESTINNKNDQDESLDSKKPVLKKRKLSNDSEATIADKIKCILNIILDGKKINYCS